VAVAPGHPVRLRSETKGIFLLGGEKGDERFYQRMIPIAEAIYKRHLAEE